MIKEIIVGLVLALVAGLTYVAYKHPKGYKNLMWIFLPIAICPLSFFIFWSILRIVTFIIYLDTHNASSDMMYVARKSAIEAQGNLMILGWALGILILIILYLLFLKDLHKILGLKTDEPEIKSEDQMGMNFMVTSGSEINAIVPIMVSVIEYAYLKNYKILTKELNRILSSRFKIYVPGRKGFTAEQNAERVRTGLLNNIAELREILTEQSKITEFEERLGKLEELIKNNVVAGEPKTD